MRTLWIKFILLTSINLLFLPACNLEDWALYLDQIDQQELEDHGEWSALEFCDHNWLDCMDYADTDDESASCYAEQASCYLYTDEHINDPCDHEYLMCASISLSMEELHLCEEDYFVCSEGDLISSSDEELLESQSDYTLCDDQLDLCLNDEYLTEAEIDTCFQNYEICWSEIHYNHPPAEDLCGESYELCMNDVTQESDEVACINQIADCYLTSEDIEIYECEANALTCLAHANSYEDIYECESEMNECYTVDYHPCDEALDLCLNHEDLADSELDECFQSYEMCWDEMDYEYDEVEHVCNDSYELCMNDATQESDEVACINQVADCYLEIEEMGVSECEAEALNCLVDADSYEEVDGCESELNLCYGVTYSVCDESLDICLNNEIINEEDVDLCFEDYDHCLSTHAE